MNWNVLPSSNETLIASDVIGRIPAPLPEHFSTFEIELLSILRGPSP